jgi:tetratricopeptide (TPR) repeat protein
MAGDQVTAAAPEQDFLFCERCGIKTRLAHLECPRCRGPLVRRNAYDVAAEWCRALEQHQVTAEVRTPKIVGAIALVVGLAGALYALSHGGTRATVEPLVLGRTTAPPASAVAEAPVEDGLGIDVPAREGDPQGAFARGDLEAALAGYLAILDQRPDDLTALNNAGLVLVRLGRAAEAVPLLERAVGVSPQVWLGQFNLGQALSAIGAWGRAAGHYQAAAALMPEHFPTLFNLGLTLQRAGRDDAAVEALVRAAALDDTQADTWLLLGTSYQRLGRRAEARDAFRRYLELSPHSPERPKVEQRLSELAAAPA